METRQSFHAATKYSLAWSWCVYRELESHYTRATETVLDILGLSSRDAVLFLANGDTSWRSFKRCVHHVAKYGVDGVLNGMIHAFQTTSQMFPTHQKGRIALLTGENGSTTMKKPGFQGGFRPKAPRAGGRKRPSAPDCFWSDPAWLKRGF